MDKGFDCKRLRLKLRRQGNIPIIPKRQFKGGPLRRTPKPHLYRARWKIEWHFSHYDQFRKLQTRYERNPFDYKAYWYLAAGQTQPLQINGMSSSNCIVYQAEALLTSGYG